MKTRFLLGVCSDERFLSKAGGPGMILLAFTVAAQQGIVAVLKQKHERKDNAPFEVEHSLLRGIKPVGAEFVGYAQRGRYAQDMNSGIDTIMESDDPREFESEQVTILRRAIRVGRGEHFNLQIKELKLYPNKVGGNLEIKVAFNLTDDYWYPIDGAIEFDIDPTRPQVVIEPVKQGGLVPLAGATSMSMLPAAPGKCQTCATVHEPGAPHNLQSLFYGVLFVNQFDRSPTWADAMAHCSPEVKRQWTTQLRERGQVVPHSEADEQTLFGLTEAVEDDELENDLAAGHGYGL
jgi:hypothetical protein